MNRCLAVVTIGMMAASHAIAGNTGENQKVEFITHFYRGYLDHQKDFKKLQSYLRTAPFFSRSLRAAIKSGKDQCAKRAQDEPCGFGADGDWYLDTQETGPALTFMTSNFKAHVSGPHSVDASFDVYPGESGYKREMRFILVREDGQWRVDEMISTRKPGMFDQKNSVRQLIKQELADIESRSRESADSKK